MREIDKRALSVPICLNSDKVKKAFDVNIVAKQFVASSDSYKCISRTKDKEENEQRKLLTHLKSIYHNKCAYCETSLLDTYPHIEHFRPKDTYYWLAYSWSNLLPVCPVCNSHKSNNFDTYNTKITYSGQRLNLLHYKLLPYNKVEQPKLLHPEVDKFEQDIFFTNKGKIMSKNERVIYTVNTCQLDREDLRTKREKVLNKFFERLEKIYTIHKTNISYYQDIVEDFFEESAKDKEFSLFKEFILKKIDLFLRFYEQDFQDTVKSAIKMYRKI